MANTIKCTKCGEEIEITEALTHQLEEQITQDLKASHLKQLADVAKKAEEKALLKVREELELQMQNSENERQELKDQKQKLQEELLKREKEKRELQEKTERIELENQKKLNEAMEKMQEEVAKTQAEKHRVEMLEYEKKINDYKKMLEEANYKLSQKSQQLQGEVMELDLEKELRDAFIYDEISEVLKGVQGADITQHVRDKVGKEAGIILWETKRAKWSPKKWLPKLREDKRKSDAVIAILVSENLPREIQNFALTEGVLITSPACAIPMATVIRGFVLLNHRAKETAMNKDDKLEDLYQYLQSESFRHRFEAFAEGISELQSNLEKERRAMETVWKAREMQIKRMSVNASRMYSELQVVMNNALPEIKTFALPGEELAD